MLEALEKSLGVVSTAAKIVGINRSTHYDWLANDEQYSQAVSDIENVALDFAESKLFKNIEKAKEASVFFT
jgi:Bacterial regulatory protein, Fis family.